MLTMRDEPAKPLPKASCLCGATLKVDPLKQDRRVTCPDCNSTFDFVVTVDAARKKSMVSIVLPKAAMKTEGESLASLGGRPEQPDYQPDLFAETKSKPAKAAPPPKAPAPKGVTKVPRKGGGKTISVPMATCECGAVFPLEDNGELTSLQSCPQCNLTYHVIFKIESGTKKKTAIIVPEKPVIKHRMQTVAPPKAQGRPGDVTDFFTKKGRTRVSKVSVKPKAPPPEIPPGAQGVPCDCGQLFVVRRRDLGQQKTCEGCGKTATFEEARDPQTLAPVIRIKK
ncbi:MAG TPA: hypothetical protein VNM14_07585 [Planctomycetota bacterium]|nr:hypothetical protein [Planctomycetota bacterium]